MKYSIAKITSVHKQYCTPCVNKQGQSNALSECNLYSELCIRSPSFFYTWGLTIRKPTLPTNGLNVRSAKQKSIKHHLNIINTSPSYILF